MPFDPLWPVRHRTTGQCSTSACAMPCRCSGGLLHNIDDLRGIGILPVGKIDSLLPSETAKSAQEGDR